MQNATDAAEREQRALALYAEPRGGVVIYLCARCQYQQGCFNKGRLPRTFIDADFVSVSN